MAKSYLEWSGKNEGGLGSSIRTGSFLWSANWSEHLIESKGLEKILWLQGDRSARKDEVTFVCSGGELGVEVELGKSKSKCTILIEMSELRKANRCGSSQGLKNERCLCFPWETYRINYTRLFLRRFIKLVWKFYRCLKTTGENEVHSGSNLTYFEIYYGCCKCFQPWINHFTYF